MKFNLIETSLPSPNRSVSYKKHYDSIKIKKFIIPIIRQLSEKQRDALYMAKRISDITNIEEKFIQTILDQLLLSGKLVLRYNIYYLVING